MLDVAEELARPLARVVLTVARVAWWLAWELCVETVGWYIGWPIWRALSLGRFPETGLNARDDAPGWACVLVELSGFAALLGLIYLLARYVQG